MEKTKNKVKKVLTNEIITDIPDGEISDTTSLFTELQLDSIQLLQLIASIEKEFDIHFSGEDLVLDAFENINSIAKMIEDKKGKDK